jgi:hypothetical protein
MDEVLSIALHRVIVPQMRGGDFVIEIEEDDEDTDEAADG